MRRLVGRPRFALVAILVIAGLALAGRSAVPLAAEPALPSSPSQAIVPGQILVKFRFDLDPTVGRLTAGALSAAPARKIDPLRVHRFAVPPGEEKQYVNRFRQSPLVEYAEPDVYLSVALLPNDPALTGTTAWHLTKIDAPAAWDVTTGSEHPVTVAVLDTGIDSTHPDLQGKVLPGYDVINRAPIPVGTNTDPYEHGTHVAGIVAAATNNGVGIAGVTWSAKILPVRILDQFGFGTMSDLAEAVTWAVDHGAKVINMSLGGSATPDEIATAQAAVEYATTRGAVLIAAAGNGGYNRIDYPASIDTVISVASTEQNDTRSSFSNYNEFVDVAAPGRAIYSTLPYARYGNKSGTSMSTPVVSGLAALLLSLDPALTPAQVTQRIISGTVDLAPAGKDTSFGWGRVSAPRTVLSSAIKVPERNVSVPPSGNTPAVLTVTGQAAGTVGWKAVSDVPWLTVTGITATNSITGTVSAQGTDRVAVTLNPALRPSDAVTGTVRVGALLGEEMIAPRIVVVDILPWRQHLPAIRRDP